ncbi:pyrroline-5-carboxylate reductase 3 isoform X2 [Numida meleagris]|uniref:pyrroline-5-carboxylate reductase 3 isoform X2 n=1 Tax=Numida meleagris TaxID=8996 RepID=UPI000B3D997E|nr:pyrroline-5-carboxylate reductase 3 isoform X2 [Numida meleagris]
MEAEELRVGFVGAGMMAGGLGRGLLRAGKVPASNIVVSAPSDRNLGVWREWGCRTTHCNLEVLQESTVVFLATKPHVLPTVLQELRPAVTPQHLLISLAAGVTLQKLQRLLPAGTKVLRLMPNLPCVLQVYLFAEAMAEGAVKMGMPVGLASRITAQTLLGAAKMLLETGEHPAKLRGDVCTPGGTTIHGLYQLEKGALRATVMNAVQAATERACEMGED